MLILLITVFSALCAPCDTKVERVCYGNAVTFPDATHPKRYNGPLYFTPTDGGRSKTLMEDGKAKDPRIKVNIFNLRLTDLNKNDEGVYAISHNGKHSNVLQLKILDCAQKVSVYYKHEWSYLLPENTHDVEYTPLNHQNVTVILWNKTNLWNNDKTKGYVENNEWKISGVTQSDNNGFYNFRQRDRTLKSRILLTVKEDTQYYDPKVKERLFIGNHWTGRPWSVTFKKYVENEEDTVIQHGQLVFKSMFYGRINLQHNGIEIYPVEPTDSGTFEFTDQQGNLALSVHVDVTREANSVVAYTIVAVVALLLGICCCFCCKKICCKKDTSTASATGVPTLIKHDNSDPTAPVVHYHPLQPNTAGYPPQTASGYPPQPASVYPPQPSNINPPQLNNINSPQPTNVYPQQPTNVYPQQPTNVYPPQPTNVYPQQPTNVYPQQPTNVYPQQPTNVYPPQPSNITPPQPASVCPPQPFNITPPQPTSVYPPQPTNINSPQPTNINPTHPEPSLYPPLSEVGSSTFQGSAAAPSISADYLSSVAEPRFQLESFLTTPPLSSDPPTCDFYNSKKQNFLGTD